jgi:hypothetical protein
MKNTETASLVFALLFSVVAGTQLVNLAKSNPLPPMYTKITIEKPLNTTYNVNTIPLVFAVDTDYSLNSYFYSLDGQERKPVENTVTILQEDINLGKSPPIIRTVLNGSCTLHNLSKGWHNVTVYQISHLIGGDPEYEIPFSESIQFKIETKFPTTEPEHSQASEPETFPIMLATAALAAVAIVVADAGLLIHLKKRKHE